MADVLFTPPTRDVSTVREGQRADVRAIARIASPMKVGKTLYKKNGTWHLEVSPGASAVEGADPIYVGGHEYSIPQETYNEIVAAGFA